VSISHHHGDLLAAVDSTSKESIITGIKYRSKFIPRSKKIEYMEKDPRKMIAVNSTERRQICVVAVGFV
jgi:hypothetical protein